jgi:hypothetical protein
MPSPRCSTLSGRQGVERQAEASPAPIDLRADQSDRLIIKVGGQFHPSDLMSLMLYDRATGGVNVSCHSGCTRQEIEGHLTRLYPRLFDKRPPTIPIPADAGEPPFVWQEVGPNLRAVIAKSGQRARPHRRSGRS